MDSTIDRIGPEGSTSRLLTRSKVELGTNSTNVDSFIDVGHTLDRALTLE
jgi:hypothetical protein